MIRHQSQIMSQLQSVTLMSSHENGSFNHHMPPPVPPPMFPGISTLTLTPQEIFHVKQAQVQQTAFPPPRPIHHRYPPYTEKNEHTMPCTFKMPFPPPPHISTSPRQAIPITVVSEHQKVEASSSSPAIPNAVPVVPRRSSPQPAFRGVKFAPEITLEKEVDKETVECLLQENKAVVVLESGKRVRSDVWLYMGRVKLLDCGLFCKEMVACVGCGTVYQYKSKSAGTSTLRHHKCWHVFQVLVEKYGRDQLNNPQAMMQMPHNLQVFMEQMKKQQQPKQTSKGPEVDPKKGFHQAQWNLNGFQGEGRQPRELTPESDDRKPVMPTPPPLKEHIMNSPSPQSVHPVSLHQGTPVSSVLGGGGLVNNVGVRSNSSVGGCVSPPPPSSKDSPPQQLLCVRWGNFDSNIVSMFSKLRSQEHFIDVTLWCEGKTIKCHKMVLSACSMYFEKLLTEYPNPHPIIFLTDMRFWEIQALVEFMYRGEVSVHQEKLQSLLRAAESLQIKGLGSPSNEMGMTGNGDPQTSMDEDMSNSTMDMTANSSLNTSNSLHNHIKDENGPNSNGSNGSSHSLHNSHILGAAINNNNNNNTNSNQAPWQKLGLTTAANMMGIDLSNHGAAAGALSLSSLHGANLPLPLSLSAGSPQSGSGSQGSGCGQASKRRKKETPRRLDLPRTAGILQGFNSTMGSEIEDDDDAASEDSMAAHERNHVDGLNSDRQQDQGYGDDEDCDTQENYDENDQGGQGEDEISSDHGEDMDEDQDGALSLRVSNLSDSERERSRKGNPMKKILGIGNNNNNNDSGPQNLIHNVTSGGD